jgi:Uma2 family endonuclease
MSTTTRLITADELLVMPHHDDHGNNCRLELLRGELKVMAPTGGTRGILCLELAMLIGNFIKAHDLGAAFGAETGFIVEQNSDTVLGIDVAFVSHERLRTIENLDKFIPFAPDLAVEVLSPGNTVSEMDEKIALYFSAGSRQVWIVKPKQRSVAVYSSPFDVRILGEKDTLDGGDVLPGFTLELSKLFGALK